MRSPSSTESIDIFEPTDTANRFMSSETAGANFADALGGSAPRRTPTSAHISFFFCASWI